MTRDKRWVIATVGAAILAATALRGVAAQPDPYPFSWSTVVNNGQFVPTQTCDPAAPAATTPPCKLFNSYNQPSVNRSQMVVFRARSRGGQGLGEPVHGVYTRDIAASGPVTMVLDRDTLVPQPNNRGTLFVEPPSFPRIDISSYAIATRGSHQPVWKVLNEAGEIVEQLGTTGIYTNPFGPLITGASKLGAVSEFSFFGVPEAAGLTFDVYPGAPAVTRGGTLVFKGNYTVNLAAKTGVYYRDLVNDVIPLPNGPALAPAGGINPVVLIANNTHTLIPGTNTVFGSTAPPSAVDDQAVFAGFDNEQNPTLGGLYRASLSPYPRTEQPKLTPLVTIGPQVPTEIAETFFNKLGEGVSFDGRFAGFWGAWGTTTKTVRLYCPQEGNKDRVAYCNQKLILATGETVGDPASICNDVTDPKYGVSCYQEKQVPAQQGIFVHDLRAGSRGTTHMVARTGRDFDDFVYWNYSGRVPGTGEGDEGGDDDGEPTRWRSTAFIAVSGSVDGRLTDANFHTTFKARTGSLDPVIRVHVNPVDGIYLRRGPGQQPIQMVAQTGMDGRLLDPKAVDEFGNGLPVTEMGIEREGFRGNTIVINVSMGSEETGWAGIYLTTVPAR
jgi:hypothetical protein